MHQLAEQLATLFPEQRRLLELHLQKQGIDLLKLPILPQPRDGRAVPLSFAQQRLWFLEQLAPGTPLANIPQALWLTGRLAVLALEQSFHYMVRRHEVLRSTCTAVDGQPFQVVLPLLAITLSMVDLRGLPASAREAVTERLVATEARRPFDLERGPLLRLTLLRLGQQEHVLLLTLHHLIADGWSLGILMREVTALYQAFSAGIPALLPALPIQYSDFAVWQRQWVHESRLASQIAYWRHQLDRSPALLTLPTDRPRPAVNTWRGACATFALPAPLSEALKALSQRAGVTLFMTLLAAFQVVLQRYSGQDDLSAGVAIAHRNRVETEGLIGCFTNMLVLRADLAGNPGFLDLLERLRQVALGAYAHQDVPFEMLVEVLQPERDLSRMPLFQVAFLMQNTVLSDLHLPGITCTFLPVHSGTARFDLTLSIMEAADGLSGSLEYRIDLFEASTIERFLQHYRNVLTACVRHPSRRLASIPLLTASERQQLLVAWNDTHQALLPETSLPALFAAQVERTPEAIAVVCEEALLTYRALNASANRLAHYLRRQGVGPEVLVGICLERSLDLVVGLLGILKAGAAYVPLDPAHPPARRQFILADSRAAVLLTHRSLGMDLAALPVRTIYLDTDRAVIARESAENLNDVRGAAQLAYVLYTSGSTGQPKGVQISHGALGNFFHSLRQQPGMTAVDVLLAVTTVAFDIATLELFLPLLVGARVVLVSRAVAADGQRLLRALATTAATVMQATPATWRLLLEAGWVGKPSLQVWCGGEALPRELALQLLASAPAVWNLYGPTETTIWSAVGPVQPGDGPVPLGRPIANTQLYVLDRFLQPVPIGVAGELYIGGAGVARGYGNRPALTAERFIGDPYSGAVGTRLYRTGDGVRRRPDGSLEFLGRLDQQVKLRGFRIEPGEVEAVLGQHAAVRQAVVLTREERPGAPRLVAYVMAHADRAPTLGELQHFLHERLPDYMVPAAFVFLDALPLTPNGKVDRQALPAPVRPDLQQAVVAPRTLLEEQLASIWAEVLQLECVGIHDNFFALGGHSLLATQVMARVSTALQAQFPLQTLFEAPTVAALALCLEAARPAGEPQPPLVRVPRSGPLPLSFAQQRLWFLDQLTPGHFLYNSAAAVRLRGGLNALALAQTFSEIVRRHEVLRATFGMLGEYPVQVIAAAAPVRLSVVDLRQVPAAQWQQAAQRLATEPFDLARGPLLRVSLLRLAEAEHMLVLVMHHIVSDGWSAGVMIREVVALYTAYTTGTPSPLPELPLQYADFAHWQRQWLQGEVLETQLAYWQQQLAGAPAALALPTDWPRPTLPSGRGTAQALALSPTLSAALRRLSERHGVTLFMTLLAAFNVMLRYHSGCDDLVVGTDVANRTRAEVEGLLGFFVNQLVLRADLRGNPTFRELLGRLRQVTLAAYAHQDIPFEMLVAALRPERRLQYAPLFQVKLVLQNAPMPAMQVAGLSLSPEILARSVVEFDLLLNLQDRPEGICGELEYRTDLFAATSIARFIEHFTTILRQVAAQPEVRLQTLEDALAAADQQHQSRHNKTLEEMHRQQLQHVRRQLRRRSAIPQNGD